MAWFYCQFPFHDFVILFLFALSFHGLPGERSFEKVDQNINQRLDIISSALLNAEMSVDRSISGCASQVLVVLISDVLFFLADILLGESEVYHVYLGDVVLSSDEEIVRFDVAMEDSSGMNKFNQLEHIETNQYCSLKCEASFA